MQKSWTQYLLREQNYNNLNLCTSGVRAQMLMLVKSNNRINDLYTPEIWLYQI